MARIHLIQLLKRATDAFKNNWNIPQAPFPPKTFEIKSQDGRIDLTWTSNSDGPEIVGYEIYRNTVNAVDGYVSDEWYSKYELIAELGADVFEFSDTTQREDISSYYYILSVGNEVAANSDLNIPAHTLKSGRSYTQTYVPAYKM